MMRLKSIPAVILTSILLLQSGGMLFILKLQQEFRKIEMSHFLEPDTKKCEKLSFTLDEFEKCRLNETELLHENKMYDIISWVSKGDHVTVIAINDSGEEHILEHIKDVAATTGKYQNNIRDLKVVFFSFLQPEKTVLIKINEIKQLFFPESVPGLFYSGIEIPSPPPKAFSLFTLSA